ncbi:hypothetical protein CDL12_18450 [Handroanthus impetiginosus]|uniref:Uncharacterized protein n=1 Tax=Handroanthus impetiginosus TaxID=429701 RepID=A0A2G9GUL4_9LAMI|nr:hypothetical protein CDL12_18450 [Handroanthus impetiginosus]
MFPLRIQAIIDSLFLYIMYSPFRSKLENLWQSQIKWKNYLLLTSAFVAHRTIGETAAFGDGNSNFRLDAGGLSRAGKKNSAEAVRVLPNSLHLLAATRRNRRLFILCCFRTRSQMHGFFIGRRFPANRSGTFCTLKPCYNKQAHKENNPQETSHFFVVSYEIAMLLFYRQFASSEVKITWIYTAWG